MDDGSLKTIEQKAYQSSFEDGLVDIFFGLLLLANAASPVFIALQLPRQIAYVPFLISPLVLILGRKFITTPRLGSVKYGASRHTWSTMLLLIIAFLMVTCMLWIIMAVGKNFVPAALKMSPHPWLVWLVEASFLTGALWLVAYFMQFTRLYLYAIIVGIGIPLMDLLFLYTGTPLNALLVYGLPGCMVVGFGLFMLLRFIYKYPPRDTSNHYRRQNGKD